MLMLTEYCKDVHLMHIRPKQDME